MPYLPRTIYNRNVPQQTPTEREYRVSQPEVFVPFLPARFNTFSLSHYYFSLSFPSHAGHPLCNDDRVALDIIITRRIRLLWIMDIPTITMRTRLPPPAARMQDADACKRM